MSVSLEDVRQIAALARLGLTDEQVRTAAAELNTILAHMEVLSRVDTNDVPEAIAAIGAAMPLRADHGVRLALATSPKGFAPHVDDGFFLVPRLATHEDSEPSP